MYTGFQCYEIVLSAFPDVAFVQCTLPRANEGTPSLPLTPTNDPTIKLLLKKCSRKFPVEVKVTGRK
jgi:hypothetical protein